MDRHYSYKKNLHKIQINSNIIYVEIVVKLLTIPLIKKIKKFIVKYVKTMLILLI